MDNSQLKAIIMALVINKVNPDYLQAENVANQIMKRCSFFTPTPTSSPL
jgi:hypothetical protein